MVGRNRMITKRLLNLVLAAVLVFVALAVSVSMGRSAPHPSKRIPGCIKGRPVSCVLTVDMDPPKVPHGPMWMCVLQDDPTCAKCK